jgi:hypothetical protein
MPHAGFRLAFFTANLLNAAGLKRTEGFLSETLETSNSL